MEGPNQASIYLWNGAKLAVKWNGSEPTLHVMMLVND